jgi:hypothetical protein
MKRSCLALLSLLLVAGPTHAAGINLAWDQCYGDATPVVRKLFACDRNTGVDALAASFIPATDHTGARLLEVQFDIQTRSGGTLPVWWDFASSSGCRASQIAFSSSPPMPPMTCQSTSPGNFPLFVLIRDNFRFPTPDHMVLVVSAQAGTTPILGGVEYFACNLTIGHGASIGPGACDGCLEPVAITLTQLRVGSGVSEILSNPAGSNVVAWQQELPVAARNVTWGAVKSLYH